MKVFRLIVLVLAVVVLHASNASADPITFVHQGMGSGSVGGATFVNAAFTITAFGDTANRSSFGNAYFIDHSSASITIVGLGTFSFTSGTRTFVNTFVGTVGVSRAGWDGTDLFTGPYNSACASWDMLSSIGPIVGTANLAWWSAPQDAVLTTGGQLLFSDSVGPTTFTATVGTVPEPASLTLLGLSFGSAVLIRRFRRK